MAVKFDVIVGNPPYQGPRITESDKGKPPTIWPRFVEICDTIVKNDGMMILLHPAMYRKPYNHLQRILYQNNRKLHVFNNAEAMKTFGVSTRFDWYVIDKTYDGLTEVLFEDESTLTVDIRDTTFVPNGSWGIWQKVRDHAARVGHLETKKNTTVPTHKGDYQVVQTLGRTKGVVFVNTDQEPKGYGVSKVIISECGYPKALYDEGKYGVSCNAYYVEVGSEEEGKVIEKFMESKLSQHLASSCKWSNFRIECVLWHFVPNVYKMGMTLEHTDEMIYEMFGLDKEEIEFIESYKYGQCRQSIKEGQLVW